MGGVCEGGTLARWGLWRGGWVGGMGPVDTWDLREGQGLLCDGWNLQRPGTRMKPGHRGLDEDPGDVPALCPQPPANG